MMSQNVKFETGLITHRLFGCNAENVKRNDTFTFLMSQVNTKIYFKYVSGLILYSTSIFNM